MRLVKNEESGDDTSPTPPLPTFPNNVELVKNEENSELLKALLPTLNKYNCLEYTAVPRLRSPFVRTFVDLYHPSGPWGKFSNAPDITSKAKYRFKSYTLPKIYETLKKCENTTNPVHLELRNALCDYMSKEKYFKNFIDKAKKIAHIEVNKPASERVPVATMSLASSVEVEVTTVSCEEDQPEALSSAAKSTAAAKTTGLADVNTRKRSISDVSFPEKENEPVPARRRFPARRRLEARRRLDSDEFSQAEETARFEEDNNTHSRATNAAASQVHDSTQVHLTPPSTPPPAPKIGNSDSCEDKSTMNTPQATVNSKDQQQVTPSFFSCTTSSSEEDEDEDEEWIEDEDEEWKEDEDEDEEWGWKEEEDEDEEEEEEEETNDNSCLLNPPATTPQETEMDNASVCEDFSTMNAPQAAANTLQQQQQHVTLNSSVEKSSSEEKTTDNSQVQLTPPPTPAHSEMDRSGSCEGVSTLNTPQTAADSKDQQHVTPSSSSSTTSSEENTLDNSQEELTHPEPDVDNSDKSEDISLMNTPQAFVNTEQQPRVTPTSSSATLASEEKIKTMESTRTKLAKLLQLRIGSDHNKFDNDPLCQKIQSRIDRLDEEMFNLILQH